ncbi:HAD-like domain-containing protein [Naematelia encephala]|uniref:HAD-like domain-containing protein n=1 Tax=Naematelia encephala TaxID=71784 RepID=A0A1Y2BLK9_9TREE|nr:HAD-like domain-containing protein [Naematelia encephala]
MSLATASSRSQLRRAIRYIKRTHARSLHGPPSAFPERLAFAFDIDGVLKQGHHVLPQAVRVMSLLSGRTGPFQQPIPFLCITNGGGVPEAERLELLSRDFGIKLSTDQLVQSHTPLRDYVHDYAEKPVLIIGGGGDAGRRIAESYGLKRAYLLQDIVAWRSAIWDRYHLSPAEESFVKRDVDFSNTQIEAIFVVNDDGLDWGLASQVITELLMSDQGRLGTSSQGTPKHIPLVFTNPDVIWGSDYPLPRLGMGAFRIALEAIYKTLTGRDLEYTQFGKPHATTYRFAEAMLRRHLSSLGRDPESPLNVYMVGDNPESDIAGANGHGWDSILVKTGVFKGGEPTHKPTRIAEHVEEGVTWAISRELAKS